MNILWVKDNNIGHEKQVKNLLDEISKKIDLHIDERLVKGFFPFFTYLENVEEKKYDLIIGAGHKTYSLILDAKKNQKSNTKSVAILSPTFNKDKFDLICAPNHDIDKFKKTDNVIFFEGSIAKVSDSETDVHWCSHFVAEGAPEEEVVTMLEALYNLIYDNAEIQYKESQ